MSAVSTESLKSLEEALTGRPVQQPDQLAGELFALADAIDSQGSFRRALTDPSRQPEQRAAIARSVLADQLSQPGLELAALAAAQRWGAERDLADALEELAVVAASLAAEERAGAAGLEESINELLSFQKNLQSSAEAQSALADQAASPEAKAKLALALAGRVTSPQGRLLLERIGRQTRGLTAVQLAQRFLEIIVKRQNRWIARVTAASPLTDQQLERLQLALNRLYGRELKLDISLDSSIIGGLRVQVADEVLDGTLSSRLSDLDRSLA